MPSNPLYLTGKAGQFIIGSSAVFFSSWDLTLTKSWADATDSSGFDPTSQQLWDKWAAGSIGGEGTITGFFDFNAGSSALLTVLLSDIPVAVTFKYNATTPFVTGSVVVTNFKSGVKVKDGDTIGFSCDFKTYGVMTLLS
jgi:hypothetical protein